MLMISVDEVMDILEEYAVCTPNEEKSLIQRINQASMFIDNIGTVSKWISVKDRLPEKDGFYLAWYTFKDGRHACDIFYYNYGYDASLSSAITHWMPLPEPPKENSDE